MKAGSRHPFLPLAILLGAAVSPEFAAPVEEYLRREVVGCRATLRSPIWKVEIEETIETLGDLFREPPAGTWVTEDGTIHHLRKSSEPAVRDPKIALLEGDAVEIVAVSAGRRRASLDLALLSDPAVGATLSLRFSGRLRKDLSDIKRFWALLARVLEMIPDPGPGGRCRGGAAGKPGPGPSRGGEGGRPATHAPIWPGPGGGVQ